MMTEFATTFLVPFLLVAGTVAFMEWFASWSHKHVMHGWGWGWHKSHHEPHEGAFEKNDLYALVFSGVAIVLFLAGSLWLPFLFWIAVGVTVYGALYFILHDGLVHQRWPFRYVPRRGYLKRVYQAHRLHHAVQGKDGCVSFGFVYAQPVDKLVRQLDANRKQFDRDLLKSDDRPARH
jgi:beta-carotene 3-hydroxylase